MNEGQRNHWNSPAAEHWVIHSDRHDRQLAEFADVMLAAAHLTDGDRVLDVGCGCGATTLAAARQAAAVLGADISEQMLEMAQRRAGSAGIDNVSFLNADVQSADLGEATFDVVISRFGVMFFDDPEMAFTNMARSLRAGGRLAMVCWRGLDENEWLFLPGTAAAQFLPLPDSATSTAPGPFAFADRDRLAGILKAGGFGDIAIDAHDTSMLLGGGGSVDDAVAYLLKTGMGRTMFTAAEPETAAAAIAAVKEALAQHLDDDGVRLGAAVWVVTASVP